VQGALLRDGAEVKLRPKSFETLKYLVVNGGRLIHKTELMSVLWPESVSVSDDSVMQCIRDVRRALGEEGPQFIRTVPGRGYIFTGPTYETQVVSDTEESAPGVSGGSITGRRWKQIAVASLISICLAVTAWAWKLSADRAWARWAFSEIQRLASEGKYEEAYRLATRALRILPSDPQSAALLREVSDTFTVSTNPAGAEVYIRRMGSDQAQRLGITPFKDQIVPRGEFVVEIRKDGYVDFERTISTSAERKAYLRKSPWAVRIDYALHERPKIPANMTFVPAGPYRLRGYSRGSEATANLKDYLIDKYEVSNRDFKAFVDAGGYLKPELWPDGKVAPALKDTTGMPGPRAWVAGAFAEGLDQHPVTGVSWDEASAYCRWQGKELPTLFQWEKAARGTLHSPFAVAMPWGFLDGRAVSHRANFETSGTTPVDSLPFGMSMFGVYNMAGNVSEWVRNRFDHGFTTAGGSFRDPVYQFGHYGGRSATDSAETVGFRCAVSTAPGAGDGDIAFISAPPRWDYPVSTAAEFQVTKSLYAYDAAPLQAAVIGVQETDQWRREEIAYDSYNDRAKAYLYLPRNATAPFQTIHFLSGDNWFAGVPVTDIVEGKAGHLAPYLRSGRAVFLVVLKGFAGREPVGAYFRRDYGSTQRLGILKNWVVDMQRGMDYLATRQDIDGKKIAFWNNSTYPEGAVIAALDNRYSAAIFMGAGMLDIFRYVPPEVNPLHFFPHVRVPKLVIHGRYDDGHPEANGRRLFALMSQPKRFVTFDGGHIAPPEITVPLVNPFLDQTLGPISQP
jgi:formylglycine-generating enzyme required for sulfatase activity/DNA-binding winged helix-turn-helix (wHTH) protein